MNSVYYFNEDERNYIIHQVLLSKESLNECCENRISKVDFITNEEANEEYKIIDSILEKLNYKEL